MDKVSFNMPGNYTFTLIFASMVILSCNKDVLPDSKPAFAPAKMYVTGENRDTTNAPYYTFSYNANDYLTRRTRFENRRIVKNITISYSGTGFIQQVIIVKGTTTDTFSYSYDRGKQILTVRKTAADRTSGMIRTYVYQTPPQDREFLYPLSILGRLVKRTDSVYANNRYASKVETAYSYSFPEPDNTEIFYSLKESLPGAPDFSSSTGSYRMFQGAVRNPFAFINPDFFEFPDELATPFPFIRKGMFARYTRKKPFWTFTELDTYETAKNGVNSGLPDQIRLTQTGRQSGIITVQYFVFEYAPR
jgi:hypothetical protein